MSLGDSVTSSLGHSTTWSLGHSVTRSPGHLVTWSLGHSVTRSLGHLVTRSLGHLVTWSLGHLSYCHICLEFNMLTNGRTTLGSTGLLRRQQHETMKHHKYIEWMNEFNFILAVILHYDLLAKYSCKASWRISFLGSNFPNQYGYLPWLQSRYQGMYFFISVMMDTLSHLFLHPGFPAKLYVPKYRKAKFCIKKYLVHTYLVIIYSINIFFMWQSFQ